MRADGAGDEAGRTACGFKRDRSMHEAIREKIARGRIPRHPLVAHCDRVEEAIHQRLHAHTWARTGLRAISGTTVTSIVFAVNGYPLHATEHRLSVTYKD
jgi:hypothetical protein